MPLHSYGVLVGQVLDTRREGSTDTPHYQIHARGAGQDYRIAVNVLSQLSPPELLYVAVEGFSHPMLPALGALADGFATVPSTRDGLALDFIRGNLFDRTAMRTMPAESPGPDNDLADRLDHYCQRAVADPAARVFAFGERWGPESSTPDKVFRFSPGNGVHDIHMNQGNDGRFKGDNGPWQDGGLLFHFPGTSLWVAIFLAFQSQSWHTDDTTGHSLPGEPGPIPEAGDPHRTIRIVGALVNAVGPAPEAETVTLLNPGPASVDLGAWRLVDRNGQQFPLTGLGIDAGEAVRVRLGPPIQLGNRGGTITLLDGAGLKVDGVAYTSADAVEGRTVVF
jgi:uncharacterized protein YukJ